MECLNLVLHPSFVWNAKKIKLSTSFQTASYITHIKQTHKEEIKFNYLQSEFSEDLCSQARAKESLDP